MKSEKDVIINQPIEQPEIIKNELYLVEFTSMTHDGMGVGRIGTYPVFVFDALVGEKAVIRLIKTDKKHGYGTIVHMSKPSDRRVKPVCDIYYSCGGCNLMHINYEGQLAFKKSLVKETMKRIGKFEDIKVKNVVGMENPTSYRNKVQVPFGVNEFGKVTCGFYRQRTHIIQPLEKCYIQTETSTEIVKFVRNLCNEYRILGYDETTKKGIIRHVLVRHGVKTNEYMVVLVLTKETLKEKDEIVSKLINRYPMIKTIVINVNTADTNTILSDKFITIYGEGVIRDELYGLQFEISPESFYQINHSQTDKLYVKAIEYAKLTGNETVVDAYCGIGTIGLIAASQAKKVYGVEIVKSAIVNARKNAYLNNIKNISFVIGKSEDQIMEWKKQGLDIDVIFVDPPRKGCEKSLLEAIIDLKIKKIVYVSCDVATFARDSRILVDGGYELKEITPFDMFPYTTHVETVTLLSLK
jgi:23S rRNA (uracil1939-C5)-methyltransferase